MIDENEIFDGIAGGGHLSGQSVREGVFEPKDLISSSPLDKKMARLLALHPELRIRFRNNDLSSLDDKTKRALLRDMQDILGITPLSNGQNNG